MVVNATVTHQIAIAFAINQLCSNWNLNVRPRLQNSNLAVYIKNKWWFINVWLISDDIIVSETNAARVKTKAKCIFYRSRRLQAGNIKRSNGHMSCFLKYAYSTHVGQFFFCFHAVENNSYYSSRPTRKDSFRVQMVLLNWHVYFTDERLTVSVGNRIFGCRYVWMHQLASLFLHAGISVRCLFASLLTTLAWLTTDHTTACVATLCQGSAPVYMRDNDYQPCTRQTANVESVKLLSAPYTRIRIFYSRPVYLMLGNLFAVYILHHF